MIKVRILKRCVEETLKMDIQLEKTLANGDYYLEIRGWSDKSHLDISVRKSFIVKCPGSFTQLHSPIKYLFLCHVTFSSEVSRQNVLNTPFLRIRNML